MECNGFVGIVEYADKNRIFHGNVINTRYVITFDGASVDEINSLKQASKRGLGLQSRPHRFNRTEPLRHLSSFMA